jgi:hypothetical protein
MKVIQVFSFNLSDHSNYLVNSFKDAFIEDFNSDKKISIVSKEKDRILGQFSIDKFYCMEEEIDEKG